MNEIILNIKRDENLEQSLLGAILLDNAQIDKIIDKVQLSDFSNPDNRIIFQSTIDVWKSQGNVDVTSLAAHLKEQGKLEDVGGGYAITGLLDECPAPSNAPIYSEKLVEFSIHNNQIENIFISDSFVFVNNKKKTKNNKKPGNGEARLNIGSLNNIK